MPYNNNAVPIHQPVTEDFPLIRTYCYRQRWMSGRNQAVRIRLSAHPKSHQSIPAQAKQLPLAGTAGTGIPVSLTPHGLAAPAEPAGKAESGFCDVRGMIETVLRDWHPGRPTREVSN